MKTIYFSNSGCSAEEEDFIRLARVLKLDVTNNLFDADCIVQHFCGMCKENFEEIPKFMFILNKIKLENPQVKIFVGGCASEVVDFQKRYPFITGVFSRRNMVEDISRYFNVDFHTDMDKPVSYHNCVRIQSGCLRHCGFCKKHYMNMPLKSKPIEQVLKDVKYVTQNGHHRSVVLLAENSTEYGWDLGYTLIDLLKEIESIPRIKLINLTAICIDELAHNQELVDYIANSNKINSVQIEIQSLIPEVRKNMQLSSSREEVLEILQKFSKKFITTNIMIGYPGETNKGFEEQLKIIKEKNLYFVQINTYNNTPETPSYQLPQVNEKDVSNRALKLTNLVAELRMAKAEALKKSSTLFGYPATVTDKKTLQLKDESILVKVDSDVKLRIGSPAIVRVTGIDNMFGGKEQTFYLKGEVI